MRGRTCVWLAIAAMSMLAHAAFAQQQDRVAAVTLDALLTRVGESAGRRYGLDDATVDGLVQSIREAGTLSGREDGHSVMLMVLVLHPDVVEAFREYLGEEQLQDYVDSVRARRRRDRQAVARHVTAWADREFSLTVKQREAVGELLARRTRNVRGMSATRMIWDRWDQRFVILRSWLPDARDEMLSQAQLDVWQALVRRGPGRRDVNAWLDPMEEHEVAFRRGVDEIARAADRGEIPEEELGPRLRGLKRRLYLDGSAVDERMEAEKRVAEARLAAHTEQLGPLDVYAADRLALVAKGVLHQHLEAMGADALHKRFRAEAQLRQDVADGALTREQAAMALGALKEEFRSEQAPVLDDITGHPLYQYTIEETLSEEAFTRYQERQEERTAYLQRALRDLAVAWKLEAIALELSAWPESDGTPAPAVMLAKLTRSAGSDFLSPWQRGQLHELKLELGIDRIERRGREIRR